MGQPLWVWCRSRKGGGQVFASIDVDIDGIYWYKFRGGLWHVERKVSITPEFKFKFKFVTSLESLGSLGVGSSKSEESESWTKIGIADDFLFISVLIWNFSFSYKEFN